MAETQRDPWCSVNSVASPLETLGATPQPVPEGKDLGHAFNLNRCLVYEDVPNECLDSNAWKSGSNRGEIV